MMLTSSLPSPLQKLSATSYLNFLEEECASYVMLTNLNSALWNPVKERLLKCLRNHLKASFKADSKTSGLIRSLLMKEILLGHYPSSKFKNEHKIRNCKSPFTDDIVDKKLATIRVSGRRCCSPCCTGAFIAETMLVVLVNQDIHTLEFQPNLCDKIYQNKAISKLLSFDINSILVHYILSLNEAEEKGQFQAPLSSLVIDSPNMGSMASQSIHSKMLRLFDETSTHVDYPFSLSKTYPILQFVMLSLANLFDRPANYFGHLTQLKLSGECINSRAKATGPKGQGVASIMACIARTCPVLKIIDFSKVTSITPESLINLCYKDTYRILHKYTYLRGTDMDGPVEKHDQVQNCNSSNGRRDKSIFVLDDRLYHYIESKAENPLALLEDCVKVSQLLAAFTDPINCMDHQVASEDQIKAPLCNSLVELKLPSDATDSRSWILPLFFAAMPNLTTLGEANVNDGLKVLQDLLPHLEATRRPLELTEAVVSLKESEITHVKENNAKRLNSCSLTSTIWNNFIEAEQGLGLSDWISTDLQDDIKDEQSLHQFWQSQIETLVSFCPQLKTLKLTIKSGVLSPDSTSIWQPLASLENLDDLRLKTSCMTDVISLLKVIGSKLAHFNLTFFDYETPMDLINVVPFYCRNLKRVSFGFLPGGPHSIDKNTEEILVRDPKFECFSGLTHFEAAGPMTQKAFCFVWKHAKNLEKLEVTGKIMTNAEEFVFKPIMIGPLFALNPAHNLTFFCVPLAFDSIGTATLFLDHLPKSVKFVALLMIQVNLVPGAGNLDEVVGRMQAFRDICKLREDQDGCQIKWEWKPDRMLSIHLRHAEEDDPSFNVSSTAII